jgi:hypothetical protein
VSQPWKTLIKPQNIDVVAPDGTVRSTVFGYYSGDTFTIDDLSVDVRPGDEIRRLLPNGNEETFNVDDPRYHEGTHFGSFYKVKVSRKGAFPRHSGGNYNISVTGPNSRVNIGSTDNSTNSATSGDLFADMRRAVEGGVSDVAIRAELISKIDEVEKAKGTVRFLQAYQTLIGTAADHLTLLTPFIPALTQLLS